MAGGRQIRFAVPLVLKTCAGDQPTENVAEEAAGDEWRQSLNSGGCDGEEHASGGEQHDEANHQGE